MGSKPIAKKQSRRPKKSLSPRFEHLEQEFIQNGGEWKDFEIKKLFTIGRGNIQNQKALIEDCNGISFIAQNESGNGFVKKVNLETNRLFPKNSIIIGRQTGVVYFQPEDFVTTDGVLVLKSSNNELNKRSGIFITSTIQRQLNLFGYTNTVSAEKLNKIKISLPTRNNEIDFSFMENTICALEAERLELLEAYLISTNLHDYHLTPTEEQALQDFDKMEWKTFKFSEVFNQIKQGRRLKKQDQLPGNIPFVMAGTTNTGVVNFISNPVATFPANAITIDIFGNTFYRNYNFGAGDDTGVYWSDSKNYSKQQMLYLATAMGKSIEGKFSYGKKLRSSQSTNFKMVLPQTEEKIDSEKMEILVKAIEKLVIKDVVLWADENIAATREVINKN